VRRLARIAVVVALAGCGGGAGSGSGTDGGPRPDARKGSRDGGADIWHPPPGTSWQWQLSGTVDTTVDVAMYDIDLFDNTADTIAALHDAGRVVICYYSAGSREDWRPDAGDYATGAIGKALDNWPGETWVDIRESSVRAVIRGRLDLAVSKGCDGVEPDNVDGYANDSGFPLTAADQLDFNRFLADEARARGLSIGLKNDLDQISDLVGDFDWALDEECFAYNECNALDPFVAAGKAVFQVEYGDATLADTVCSQANAHDFDTLIKKLELGAWRVPCR